MKKIQGFICAITLGLLAFAVQVLGAEAQQPLAHWTFDLIAEESVPDVAGNHFGTITGHLKQVDGVDGQCLVFAGEGDCVSISDTPELSFVNATFSLSAWVNVYALNRGQQVIIGKNNYAVKQRELSLMVDADNRFAFYLYDQRWTSLKSKTKPKLGQWVHLAVTVDQGYVRLYVNGVLENEGPLGKTLADTAAPLTIGAINNSGKWKQQMFGAVDEVEIFSSVLNPQEIKSRSTKDPAPHVVPGSVTPVTLWNGSELPNSADIPVLGDVEFQVIKPFEFLGDGYRFMHGVALAWHRGRLYSSFGHNMGSENSSTEVANGRFSDDGGRSWSELFTIDSGEEDNLAISHGAFMEDSGQLWAFHGAYTGAMERVHTRAYLLNDAIGTWEQKGTVVEGGFWPLQEPLKMADGNWIMSGLRVANGYPGLSGNLPAVAISRGNDFLHWDLIVLQPDISVPVSRIWGESTVFVNGSRIVNISRWGRKAIALASESKDYGRTWTPLRASNLPMTPSKPYTGTLSTGENYLICTTAADSGGRRSPLTIALTRPGETSFSKVFVIRRSIFPAGPGESHSGVYLAYPYAVEYNGYLYVGYSNSGGGVGREGEGRERLNNNSAELAIIPIDQLECR